MKEFDSELVGIGVLVDNKQIEKKLVDEYVSIVELKAVDKSAIIGIQPSKHFLKINRKFYSKDAA